MDIVISTDLRPPIITCCGYRFIPSRKSQHVKYPLWLLRFDENKKCRRRSPRPPRQQHGDSNDNINSNSNEHGSNNCNENGDNILDDITTTTTTTRMYRWRSKRDFLLLNRFYRRLLLNNNDNDDNLTSKTATTHANFPKSALAKLSECCIYDSSRHDNDNKQSERGGWIVPLTDDDDGTKLRWALFGCNHDNTMNGILPDDKDDDDDNSIPYNKYHPRMKKSINEMNKFLTCVHNMAMAIALQLHKRHNNNTKIDINNHDYQQQQAAASSSCIILTNDMINHNKKSYNSINETQIEFLQSWIEFIRDDNDNNTFDINGHAEDDTLHIESLSNHNTPKQKQQTNNSHDNATLVSSSKTTTDDAGIIATSASLGQYFASSANATFVVQKTLAHIRDMMMGGMIHDDDDDMSDDAIFVEPSCGNGNIISHLIDYALDTSTKSDFYYPRSIVGYDIDSRAITACRNTIATKMTMHHNSGTPPPHVALRQCDFLTVTREDIQRHAAAAAAANLITPNNNNNNNTTITNASTKTNHSQSPLIILGGPPYTTGRGPRINRTLPLQFVRHCLINLSAHIVVFLLPKRCQNDDNSSSEDMNLLQAELAALSLCDGRRRRYGYESVWEGLPEDVFYFEGRRVEQPSILGCWYRVGRD